jgi:hypothetical protein
MSTGQDLIYRSLRLLKVKQTGQTPAAEEMADALSALNGLLAELYGSDIAVPDYTVTLVGTLTMDAADFEAIAYMLAVRIASEYGAVQAALVASPAFVKSVTESESRLRLRYFQPGTVSFSELPSATGNCFDFNNG